MSPWLYVLLGGLALVLLFTAGLLRAASRVSRAEEAQLAELRARNRGAL